MKTLGKIFLFLVFAAIVSGIYYWQVVKTPVAQIPSKVVSTKEVYINDEYNFEVRYNRQYQLEIESDNTHYFKTGGAALATINIPRGIYPDTNLGLADVTFAGKSKTTEADCLTYVTSANTTKKMTQQEQLNTTVLYTAELGGAALGTQYRTKLYRTWTNPGCIEISLTVGISNIENYDPQSGVTEVSFEKVFLKLQEITSTFKLLTPVATEDEQTGELTGHIAASSPEAYELTQIVVYTEDKNKIVAKISPNSSGDYFVELPVGTYYVTYTSIYNTFQPALKKIIINADEESTADFSITSK